MPEHFNKGPPSGQAPHTLPQALPLPCQKDHP